MDWTSVIGASVTAGATVVVAAMGLRRKSYADRIKECTTAIDAYGSKLTREEQGAVDQLKLMRARLGEEAVTAYVFTVGWTRFVWLLACIFGVPAFIGVVVWFWQAIDALWKITNGESAPTPDPTLPVLALVVLLGVLGLVVAVWHRQTNKFRVTATSAQES